MGHIALIITGLTGKLNASFEMASRLQKEGHRVTYLCPVNVSKKVEKHGHKFIQLPEINFKFSDLEYDRIASKGWFSRFSFHFENLSNHYKNGKRILHLENYKELIKELNPTKVWVDMELHEIILVAMELKIPVTLFSSWFSNRMSLDLPPPRSTCIPKNGSIHTRMTILKDWSKEKIKTWGKLAINRLNFRNYRRATLKKYAKKVGLDMGGLSASNFPPLFSYSKQPIVTITMKELDFPHEPRPNLAYVGPMVFRDRHDRLNDVDMTRKLLNIFKKKEHGKKIIYCSFGSFVKTGVSFLNELILSVKNESDWILLISMGNVVDGSDLVQLPDNTYVFDWLPQLEVLEQADCNVAHGGIHTISECIHFSVPMLIYSGKNFDQNGNAARIEYHGLGLVGDKDSDDSEIIRGKINKVLTDTSFHDKMSAINKIYNGYREQEIFPFLN